MPDAVSGVDGRQSVVMAALTNGKDRAGDKSPPPQPVTELIW